MTVDRRSMQMGVRLAVCKQVSLSPGTPEVGYCTALADFLAAAPLAEKSRLCSCGGVVMGALPV